MSAKEASRVGLGLLSILVEEERQWRRAGRARA